MPGFGSGLGRMAVDLVGLARKWSFGSIGHCRSAVATPVWLVALARALKGFARLICFSFSFCSIPLGSRSDRVVRPVGVPAFPVAAASLGPAPLGPALDVVCAKGSGNSHHSEVRGERPASGAVG